MFIRRVCLCFDIVFIVNLSKECVGVGAHLLQWIKFVALQSSEYFQGLCYLK